MVQDNLRGSWVVPLSEPLLNLVRSADEAELPPFVHAKIAEAAALRGVDTSASADEIRAAFLRRRYSAPSRRLVPDGYASTARYLNL